MALVNEWRQPTNQFPFMLKEIKKVGSEHYHEHHQCIYVLFWFPTMPWISPHLIPSIIPTSLPVELHYTGSSAEAIISRITNDIVDAKDNLLLAKLTQASTANTIHSQEMWYQVGNKEVLSTLHGHHEYKQKGDRCATNFFPRWDGLYMIIKVYPESSSYSLNNNTYPYCASQLKLYHANDSNLFPNCKLPKPRPVLTPEGLQEHIISWILDTLKCGLQYLVCWVGFRPGDNKWLMEGPQRLWSPQPVDWRQWRLASISLGFSNFPQGFNVLFQAEIVDVTIYVVINSTNYYLPFFLQFLCLFFL